MRAALSLLEAQHIQTGHAIVIDAWCRRLVTAIPRRYNARVALLEASWSLTCARAWVVSPLLEAWPGRIPSVLASSPQVVRRCFQKVAKTCALEVSICVREMPNEVF